MYKYLLSILSGLLLALSFPGHGLLSAYLAWIFLVPLLYAVEDSSWKKSLFLVLIMSTTAHIFIGDGIWYAMRTYYELSFPKSLFIFFSHVIILSSLPWMIYILLFNRLYQRTSSSTLFLAVLWSVLEFLYAKISIQGRTVWLGYTQHDLSFLFPIAQFFGTLGLSIFVIFINLLIYTWLQKNKPLIGSLIFFLVFLACFLMPPSTPENEPASLRIGILQSNLPYPLHSDPVYNQKQIERLLKMSKEAKEADLILWPSASIALYGTSNISDYTKAFLPNKETRLLIGTTFYKSPEKIFNGIAYADANGKIIELYQKVRLTPFTEYLPFGFVDLIGKKKNFPQNFSASETGVIVFELGHYKAVTPICLESLYPEIIHQAVKLGANCIIHFSNDSIYGDTNFPRLLLVIAKMRSVEFGLPALRETINGISAIISANGLIIDSISYGRQGLIITDFKLPKHNTLFSQYGNSLWWGLSILCILWGIIKLVLRQGKHS